MSNLEDKEYVDLSHTHIIQVDNHSFFESLIDMVPLALEKFSDAGTIGGYSLENVVDVELGEDNFYCLIFKTDKNIDIITPIESLLTQLGGLKSTKKNKDKNQNNDRRK
jgi:hypothetical protein|tara:strand:+ start:89 stop:415 length:327 start_codon:yes stop_codon:yes gene_type:complete